jgi:3-oxoacyl-[acyl-carrier protein] reductase
MPLQDKVAVVTGAQQGIGAAIAIAFGKAGANVIINYLDDPSAAQAVADKIEKMGRQALALQGDVSKARDMSPLLSAADVWGGIDIMVNNAGIFPRVDFLEMTEAQWDKVQTVNLKGAFLGTQLAAKAMIATGKPGSIINLSSNAAFTGSVLGVHYAASKAGVIGLTKAAARSLAPHGIRVNAIAPGLTNTAQPKDAMTEQQISDEIAEIPLQKIATPEDIANTALFLAGEGARQITGQTLHVNGGYYLG